MLTILQLESSIPEAVIFNVHKTPKWTYFLTKHLEKSLPRDFKGRSPKVSREVGLVRANIFSPHHLTEWEEIKTMRKWSGYGPLKKNILRFLRYFTFIFLEIHHTELHLKYHFLSRCLFHGALSVPLFAHQE